MEKGRKTQAHCIVIDAETLRQLDALVAAEPAVVGAVPSRSSVIRGLIREEWERRSGRDDYAGTDT